MRKAFRQGTSFTAPAAQAQRDILNIRNLYDLPKSPRYVRFLQRDWGYILELPLMPSERIRIMESISSGILKALEQFPSIGRGARSFFRDHASELTAPLTADEIAKLHPVLLAKPIENLNALRIAVDPRLANTQTEFTAEYPLEARTRRRIRNAERRRMTGIGGANGGEHPHVV